jgi:hypothetical protein
MRLRLIGVGLATALVSACTVDMGGATLTPASVAPTSPVRPAPQLLPPPAPSSLVGLDSYGLRKAFGSPEFRRYEPGAEIWRYGGESCSLFVYLYEDDENTLRTAFVEARAEGGGELPSEPCIAEVSRSHQLSAQSY